MKYIYCKILYFILFFSLFDCSIRANLFTKNTTQDNLYPITNLRLDKEKLSFLLDSKTNFLIKIGDKKTKSDLKPQEINIPLKKYANITKSKLLVEFIPFKDSFIIAKTLFAITLNDQTYLSYFYLEKSGENENLIPIQILEKTQEYGDFYKKIKNEKDIGFLSIENKKFNSKIEFLKEKKNIVKVSLFKNSILYYQSHLNDDILQSLIDKITKTSTQKLDTDNIQELLVIKSRANKIIFEKFDNIEIWNNLMDMLIETCSNEDIKKEIQSMKLVKKEEIKNKS